jgi:hypothetical protein
MRPSTVNHRPPTIAISAFAAILLLGACGADDEPTGDAPIPPPTTVPQPVTVPDTSPPTTAPPTTAPPTTAPPTKAPPIDDQLYEVIATVIDDSNGPRMCFEVMDSLPPQCGNGLALVDWSWDAIDVEITQGDTTWVDQIYVAGTYAADEQTFTVDAARIPTPDDRERILMTAPIPDHSIPCPAPDGGWPERTQEWPGEEIAALDGYAGVWVSDPGVVTVKFTGDLDAAEAAVREHYTDALCVVSATYSEAELSAIQEQLLEMSSVQFLSTAIYVDATGEWVAAETIAPDPALQAAFDEEFGPGVVRLDSSLRPVE